MINIHRVRVQLSYLWCIMYFVSCLLIWNFPNVIWILIFFINLVSSFVLLWCKCNIASYKYVVIYYLLLLSLKKELEKNLEETLGYLPSSLTNGFFYFLLIKTYLYFMFQSIVAVFFHFKHTSLSFDHESYINLWKNNHFIIVKSVVL